MNASANPLKNLAFWDQVRRLQQGCTGDKNSRAGSAGSQNGFNVIGTYLIGLVMIIITVTGIVKHVRNILATRRVNAVDTPELPQHDEKLPKIPKSTLAKRKQAILELFETSQVTMVSNDKTAMAISHIRISISPKKETTHHIVLFSESVKGRYSAWSRR
jgi:hypothetical protein